MTASHAAPSLDYLYSGSAKDFVDALKMEVDGHPALRHRFLTMLRDGEFKDTAAVLRSYAHQYSFYSNWFVRYVDGVMSQLTDPRHAEQLKENLEDEMGTPGSPNKADLPHTEIFGLFKQAVGADADYCGSTPPFTTVLLWRDLFLQKCSSDIRGVGIAALGLGTEAAISTVYPHFIGAIKNHTDFGPDASLFFEIHVECDDEHGEVLEEIVRETAEDISTREAIRFGVNSSLNLRHAFWDAQLAWALAAERA